MYKKTCLKAVILAVLLIFIYPATGFTELKLDNYEAIFEIIPNSGGQYKDIAATLNMTFVTDTRFSNGFKFVGSNYISEVRAMDETGDIGVEVQKLNEYKITFRFPEIVHGKKKITLNFKIHDALSSGIFSNTLNLPWVGKWKIPVNMSRYVVVFPENFTYKNVSSNLLTSEETTINGKPAIAFPQSNVTETSLSMSFKPLIDPRASNLFMITLLIWIILLAFWVTKYRKLSAPRPTDSSEPAPYEAAYMKKGRNHAVMVCLFDLIQKGYIILDASRDMTATGKTDGLTRPESALIETVRIRAAINEVFLQKDLLKRFEYETLRALEVKGMIKGSLETKSFCNNLRAIAVFSVIALVGANLYMRFPSGEGMMFFSLIMPVLAFISSFIMQRSAIKTQKGKAYLRHLESRVSGANRIAGLDGHYDPMLSYAVAALGMTILAGTVFAGISEALYYRETGGSTSDTGSSSCSGCSTSDSGGGGGCSGCGGGGD
ncbi:MAG: TIGR04222 domain-containing membrane protein [Nitrospirae bacterium YQR-1]